MKIERYKGKFVPTSFYGDTIRTNGMKLIELFGDYQIDDPYKVNYAWDFILNGEIPFTIYDWKEFNLSLDDITNYHIGARNAEESKLIKKELIKYGINA